MRACPAAVYAPGVEPAGGKQLHAIVLVRGGLAAAGSGVGASVMHTRLTSSQRKRFIGFLPWVIRRQDGVRPAVSGPASP